MNIIVQFEGSNRWPEDLASVQRTKIAFLLKMGELLEEKVPGLMTRLGLENGDQKLWNGCFLDIIYPKDTAFRVRIHHELELARLFDRKISRNGTIGDLVDIDRRAPCPLRATPLPSLAFRGAFPALRILRPSGNSSRRAAMR